MKTQSFFLSLFLSIAIFLGPHVSIAGYEEYEEQEILPPDQLPSLENASKRKIIDSLKQYVKTGEKLADQFESLLNSYTKTINTYVRYKGECDGVKYFNTPLFSAAQEKYSICSPANLMIHRQRLEQQARRLDGLEADLLIIKDKMQAANQAIVGITKNDQIKKMLIIIDEDITTAEGYKIEAERIEKMPQ